MECVEALSYEIYRFSDLERIHNKPPLCFSFMMQHTHTCNC